MIKKYMNKVIRLSAGFFLLFLSVVLSKSEDYFTAYADNENFHAPKNLTIYNLTDNETIYYTKNKISIISNHSYIETWYGLPGIEIDNLSMVPYDDLFFSSLCADVSYDEITDRIIIEANGNRLVMTLGSKKAVLNEQNVSLTAAPVKLRFEDYPQQPVKIYVPARCVSSMLGYDYYWDNDLDASFVNKTYKWVIDGEPVEYKNYLYHLYIADTYISYADIEPVIRWNGVIMADVDTVLYKSLGIKMGVTDRYIYLTANKRTLRLNLKDRETLITTESGETQKYFSDVAPVKILTESSAENIYVSLFFVLEQLGYTYDFDSNESARNIFVSYDSSSIPNVSNIQVTENNGIFTACRRSYAVMSKLNSITYPVTVSEKSFLFEKDLTGSGNYGNVMVIPLPCGSEQDLEYIDNYQERKIKFSIKGDYQAFYSRYHIYNPYYVVKDITVSYDAKADKTWITISTGKIQASAYKTHIGYLMVCIDNPENLYDKILVLDPGHGGSSVGISVSGYTEKSMVLKMVQQYMLPYFEKFSDIKVYVTRSKDEYISIYKRADFSDETGADMFVSLHINGAPYSPEMKGAAVFYSTYNNQEMSNGLKSSVIAEEIVSELSKSLETTNRGVLEERFVVCMYNTVPSVLIEPAFLTNPYEFKRLIDTYYQEKAANSICESIIRIFEQYGALNRNTTTN